VDDPFLILPLGTNSYFGAAEYPCHKWLFGACGVCFGDEKGFNVGFNSKLP